jgi:hypothetical protein
MGENGTWQPAGFVVRPAQSLNITSHDRMHAMTNLDEQRGTSAAPPGFPPAGEDGGGPSSPRAPGNTRRAHLLAAVLAAIALIAAAGVVIGHFAWTPSTAPAAPAPATTPPLSYPSFPGGSYPGSGASGAPTNAASLAQAVDPVLVDINSTLPYQAAQAAGTGMVLTPGGEILTNNHVIEGPEP